MSAVTGPDLCYIRGDTAPLTLKFARAGVAEDFTGYTLIVLTVTSEENPPDTDEQLFQMDGTIGATQGDLEFDPQGADESAKRTESEGYAIAEGLFYDVQADDATGRRVTLIHTGSFQVLQDITKD